MMNATIDLGKPSAEHASGGGRPLRDRNQRTAELDGTVVYWLSEDGY